MSTKKIESESFEAGYGKAVELIEKVARALPGGVPGYCKGGALAHLTTGYAVLRKNYGKESALKWLRVLLETAVKDMNAVADGAVRITVEES